MPELRIRRAAALSGINDDECVAGYRAGLSGQRQPASASFSFRHGHRNGMVDSGRRQVDKAGIELARDCIASGYLNQLLSARP